jgi:hypothetical protein
MSRARGDGDDHLASLVQSLVALIPALVAAPDDALPPDFESVACALWDAAGESAGDASVLVQKLGVVEVLLAQISALSAANEPIRPSHHRALEIAVGTCANLVSICPVAASAAVCRATDSALNASFVSASLRLLFVCDDPDTLVQVCRLVHAGAALCSSSCPRHAESVSSLWSSHLDASIAVRLAQLASISLHSELLRWTLCALHAILFHCTHVGIELCAPIAAASHDDHERADQVPAAGTPINGSDTHVGERSQEALSTSSLANDLVDLLVSIIVAPEPLVDSLKSVLRILEFLAMPPPPSESNSATAEGAASTLSSTPATTMFSLVTRHAALVPAIAALIADESYEEARAELTSLLAALVATHVDPIARHCAIAALFAATPAPPTSGHTNGGANGFLFGLLAAPVRCCLCDLVVVLHAMVATADKELRLDADGGNVDRRHAILLGTHSRELIRYSRAWLPPQHRPKTSADEQCAADDEDEAMAMATLQALVRRVQSFTRRISHPSLLI